MERVKKQLQVECCFEKGIFGQNIGTAILDTGVYRHPNLGANIRHFEDCVWHLPMPYDDNGHGTHIAGIICDRKHGIAPQSNVVCIKVLKQDGQGKIADVVSGIMWILKNYEKYGIRIVNISLGAKDEKKEDLQKLLKGVEQLWDEGLIVVASAGNNGPGLYSVTVPGINCKIITVGAMDDQEQMGRQKNYSGRGPTKECAVKPEIVTYGSHIYSCSNHANAYEEKSGTSMATAIVSGAIALALSRDPSLTNQSIKQKLKDTAQPLALERHQQGWGGLNLKAFVLK